MPWNTIIGFVSNINKSIIGLKIKMKVFPESLGQKHWCALYTGACYTQQNMMCVYVYICVYIYKEKLALAGVAQWIECWPMNQRVAGSIPSQGTCLVCGSGPQ